MSPFRRHLTLAALLALGAISTRAFATTATITVTTTQQLTAAITSASGGERIIVAPGQYSLAATIRVAPLTIEAQSTLDRPVLSIASGSTILTVDAGPVTGITIRNLVFAGNGQAITAIRSTKCSGITVQGCAFTDYEGEENTNPILHFSYDGNGREDLMQPCLVSGCRFSRAPRAKAIYSLGPTTVEDCTFENIKLAVHLVDYSSYWSTYPRMNYENIVRRNEIYRTEGTAWNCRGIVTMSTAPKIYENRIYDTSIGEGCETIVAIGNNLPGTPTRAEIYRNVIASKWKAADSTLIHEGIEYGEPPGDYGLIYENVLVGYIRPGLYNKGDHNRWFNNTTYFTDPDGYNFHCYGVGTEFKNNLQVGGRMLVRTAAQVADGVAKGWYPPGSDSDFPPMQYTCFWQLNEGESRYAEGPGFLRADPRFVDPTSLDFRLRWDSPCINAGDGSRDGLTATDIGAFEYPIQVDHFSVTAGGVASWQWHHGFQSVAQRVIVRWHAQRFPSRFDDPADTTVADVSASATSTQTTKTAGYFATFVQDINGNWSAPTPDNVHRYYLKGSATPDTFAGWVTANFTAAEQANTAISSPAADPDGCGVTNLARYAFDLAARGPVSNPITVGTTVVGTDSFLTLTFPRRADATGLNYTLESSTDLATWTTVPGQTYTAGTEPITARDAVAVGAAPRRFLRLRVTQN